MKTAAETREVITFSAEGVCLRGTHHKPGDVSSGLGADFGERHRTGVLFLTGSVVPRAAFGDWAVHLADGLAKTGYRCFRFDFPGLGDSDGDAPRTETAFLSLVNAGAFSRIVCGIANHLAERFGLQNVVVLGHCGGAVTALYAAACNGRIQGLVLMDPYFNVQPKGGIQSALALWVSRLIGKVVGNGSAGHYLRAVRLHSYIRNIYRRQKNLPGTSNLPLIRCWNELTARGLPILILRSPSSTPKPGEFDYIRHLQPPADRDNRVSIKHIEGATHGFAERQAKEAVRRYTEHWLECLVHDKDTGTCATPRGSTLPADVVM